MKPILSGAVVLCSLYFAAHTIAQSEDDYPQPTPPPNPAVPPCVQRALTDAAVMAIMTVDLPKGQLKKLALGGITEPVVLLPGHPVKVTVTLPVTSAGHAVTIDPLDGGRVLGNGNRLLVASDGTIEFKFKPRDEPGVFRIALRDDATEIGLQFWVFDQANPENNPASSEE